jgi:hypothetical protein
MNNETLYNETNYHEKLSITDKMAGVFTEPSKTFERISNENPSFINWLIPILSLIICSALMSFLILKNPVIKYQAVEKQMERIEVSVAGAVEAGQMTQEQADAQLEDIRTRVEQQVESGAISNSIAIVVVTFVMFFVIAGVLFLLAKFLLKGDGNYSSAMTAYGLAYYILVVQVIIMLIYSLATDSLISATSVAYFLGTDTKTITGFLLNKIDPFTIWFYAVVSIGLAKLFKSTTTGKYFIAVFGLWLGFSTLFFIAAQQLPLLQMFIQ